MVRLFVIEDDMTYLPFCTLYLTFRSTNLTPYRNACNSSAIGLSAEVACNFLGEEVGISNNTTVQVTTSPTSQPIKESIDSVAGGIVKHTGLSSLLMYAFVLSHFVLMVL